MKRKMVMCLCAVACMGMLFGCGKEETTDVGEISVENRKADEEESATEEETLQESDGEKSLSEEETDLGMDAETDEEIDNPSADTSDAGEEAYTAEEMINKMSQPANSPLFAIQRGELFYPLEKIYDTVPTGDNSDDNILFMVEDDYDFPTVDFSQGEAVVVFKSNDYLGVDRLGQVLDTAEHYCVPVTVFDYLSNQDNIYIRPSNFAYDYENQKADDAFLDGAYDFYNTNADFAYSEYDAESLIPEKGENPKWGYLMTGEKDEVKELGGYEGSVYNSIRLKCTAKYYELTPIADYEPQLQQTKNGYEILFDGSENLLESGVYGLGTDAIYAFQVINE